MKIQSEPTPEQLLGLELLRNGESFLLVGHVRPDGDCIGAQAALARALGLLGKEVHIVNPDGPGPEFEYLARHTSFERYEGGALPEHDVCVLLDINELSRCGALEEPLRKAPSKKMVVDHHPYEGEPWWDGAFVDVSASATGLLVHRIMRALGLELDAISAAGVFTSLVTDTGWFRYSNTDAETLLVAAELVDSGVDPSQVFDALYQRNASTEPLAISGLLRRLEYFADGRLAVVDQPLDAEETRDLTDADPVLDILRSVGDVEVVLYVKEIERGVCKLSARSKTDFDVNALARRFGGGGHKKASGATIRGGLKDVRGQLIEAALKDFGVRVETEA